MKPPSSLERKFIRLWTMLADDHPAPVREYRFHPMRQWRFDFAWPEHRVAVEIDGGMFVHGRHQRGPQFAKDCEKLNQATLLGWRVLRYTTIDLRQSGAQLIEEITSLLAQGTLVNTAEQRQLFSREGEGESRG